MLVASDGREVSFSLPDASLTTSKIQQLSPGPPPTQHGQRLRHGYRTDIGRIRDGFGTDTGRVQELHIHNGTRDVHRRGCRSSPPAPAPSSFSSISSSTSASSSLDVSAGSLDVSTTSLHISASSLDLSAAAAALGAENAELRATLRKLREEKATALAASEARWDKRCRWGEAPGS